MTSPAIEERIDELCREFGEGGVEDALLMFALRRRPGLREIVRQLDEHRPLKSEEWLSAAALLATRPDAMVGAEGVLRDWLALFALRDRLFHEIEGASGRIPDNLMRSMATQTEIQREAIARIWQEPTLTPAKVAAKLGWRRSYHSKLRRYRLRSWLVGLFSGSAYHYPEFQFDVPTGDVFPEVRAINEMLEASSDPWGVASWWVFSNDRLGARPADLVGTDRSGDLVEAAEAVLEPVG